MKPVVESDSVYKFVDSEHIDSIVRDGTVRIASLSHYRALERERIGDPLEGTTEVTPVDHLVLMGDGHTAVGEPYTPAGWPRGILMAAEGTVIGKNVTFRYQYPEVYIFCASQGKLETLVDAMCRKDNDSYNACVWVRGGIDLLAHRMFRRGIISELNERVHQVFNPPVVGPVIYEPVVQDHRRKQAAPAPNPFRKSPEHSPQSEVRIVLQPQRPLEIHQLTIKLPRPQSLFEEVFRKVPPRIDVRG